MKDIWTNGKNYKFHYFHQIKSLFIISYTFNSLNNNSNLFIKKNNFLRNGIYNLDYTTKVYLNKQKLKKNYQTTKIYINKQKL